MALTGSSISLLVNWHKETSFLDLMWQSVKSFVDEVVVIVGPYDYLVPALTIFGAELSSNEAETIFRRFVDAPQIRFIHGPWGAEDLKRIQGYNHCSGDIIISVDSDEVTQINQHTVSQFIASVNVVASFDVVNILNADLLMANSLFDCVENFPRKPSVFKREAISGIQYINFLWLVGVKQDNVDSELVFPLSAGLCLHATGPRNLDDHLVRVLFYQSLWHRTNQLGDYAGFIKNLEPFSRLPRAYLAQSLTGIGLDNFESYIQIPNASWVHGPWWARIRDRAAIHMTDRWNGHLDISDWPRPGKYWLSRVQIDGCINDGQLTQANLEGQQMRSLLDNGQVVVSTYNSSVNRDSEKTEFIQVNLRQE